MSTTSYQHSDELNTKIGFSAVPSDDVVGSAWVPIERSTGGKKPEPKQGELMERDLEQNHDLSAQEGTDAAPIEEPAVEEIASTRPEPDIPSEEHATPEVAGPSPETSLAGIMVQQPMMPSEAERPSGERPEARGDFPEAFPSELEALQKLQRLGLTEVEGQPLEALLSLAQSRALALGRLAEARKNFADGMDKSDEMLIKNAYENAQAALGMLQEIQYPEGETFAARRSTLAGDLAQIRALLAALDTWWWRRFAQALAEVYAHLKTPEQANASLRRAETLLERWPDIPNSAKAEAPKALETARQEVEGLIERQFGALLDEAQAWIKLVNSTTGSAAGEQTDGVLALEYVMRAEAACKAAERLKDEMKGAAKGRSTTALNDFTLNLERARQIALQKFPSTILERRRKRIAEQIEAWQREYTQAAKTEKEAWDYLFTATDGRAHDLRRRLDELIEIIRLDPDYALDDPIHDLIRRREQNRRRSAELVGEIRRLSEYVFPAPFGPTGASGNQPEAERYLYTMWCICEEARKLDPDLDTNDNEIGQLFTTVEERWRQMQNDVERQIEAIETQLGETQNLLGSLSGRREASSPLMAGAMGHDKQTIPDVAGKPDMGPASVGTQLDALAKVRARLDEVHRVLQALKSNIEKLEWRLSSHLKVQPKWDQVLAELRRSWQAQSEQWQKLDAICRDAEDLVEGWRTPYDLVRLIARTQSLCRSEMPSPPLRAAVLESLYHAVRATLPTIRQRPLPVARQIELTLLLLQLLQSKRELKNDALARRAI